MRMRGLVVTVGALAVALTAVAARAELKIGDPAPKWSGLTGTDGAKHGLADYADAKVLVVVFTCNTCPVAKAYQDRLIALQKDYQPKGVRMVAINPNDIKGDKLDDMKTRAKEKGFNFAYLYDPTQQVGHDYGAQTTPHVFVFDKARKLAYVGGVDDAMDAKDVKAHYLRDALDSLLAGKPPAKDTTPHPGCSIKYRKK